MTLHVPFRVVKRGGQEEMQLPGGVRQPRRTDNTLARAFRWKQLLESGEFATIAELAETEGFEPSRQFPAYSLSRGAPSTTRPRLHRLPYPFINVTESSV